MSQKRIHRKRFSVGDRVEMLIVKEVIEPNKECKTTSFRCLCDCGTEAVVPFGRLGKTTKSCGCRATLLMRQRIDLKGQEFGKLLVTEFSHTQKHKAYWKCKCACGTEKAIHTNDLRSGKVVSCGCHKAGLARLGKGEAGFNQIYRAYKFAAKKRQQEFSLSPEQFKQLNKMDCFFCGIPPSQVSTHCPSHNQTEKTLEHAKYVYNGIDRIDPSIGYTWENSQPCCRTCNFMRQNLSVDAFIDKVHRISRHLANQTQE
jgi:hypothetical protein